MRAVHPAVSIIAASGLLFSLLLTRTDGGIIYLLILMLGIALAVKIDLRSLSRNLLKLWPILLITFLFHILLGGRNSAGFTHTQTSYISQETLRLAVLFTGRLVLILTLSLVLFALHTPEQLARQIGRWLSRLPFGRRAVGQTELLTTLSLKFVPFLAQEHHRLQLAWNARGSTSGGRVARLRRLREVMYPLMVSAFRRADHVALAVQARGYGLSVIRTSCFSRRLRVSESVEAGAIVMLSLAALWL